MAVVREKPLTQMTLYGAGQTHARAHVKVGVHEVVIDEPKSRGGTDMAPTPLETMIASLIGCTNVILNKIAERDRITVDALVVDAVATLDRRGTTLQEYVSVPFPTIKLGIAFATDADDTKVAKLKGDLGRFCPVSKILRQTGTKIEEDWKVTPR